MSWTRCLCLRPSPPASSEDKVQLQKLLKEAKKCKKTRRLLQRDLREVRRLHRKNAHLRDAGGLGQALEIDLVSRIRAADIRIIECEAGIAALKHKRHRVPAEEINSPRASTRNLDGCGGGDQEILLTRARVVQELQMLFGGAATVAARDTGTVRAYKMYYEPFKYM